MRARKKFGTPLNINSSMSICSHATIRIYKDQLALSRRHLDGLLEDTTSALDLLADLSSSFKSVEAQTKAFQAQCEDLLGEQKHVRALYEDVGSGLQYYAYLEPITRRLNAPGASSVIGDDGFVEMLTNLDACIDFMIKHVSQALFLAPGYGALLFEASLVLLQNPRHVKPSANPLASLNTENLRSI